MRVSLFQLDGSLPNLALMRIGAHHRALGDEVSLAQVRDVRAVERGLFEAAPDRAYASLIFERSRPIAERLRQVWPGVILGGTGWDLGVTVNAHGIPARGPLDYSLYPSFRQSLGFTQRGCRLKCSFCVVPRKEGSPRQEATIAEIWRGEPWPKEMILLDNDFFGQPAWRERVAELRVGGFKVCFSQGINARMLSEEAAEAIASVDYRSNSMKYRTIYTAWDSRGDEEVLFRGLDRLLKYGVKPGHIMVYMLIGYWPGESEQDWLYRRARLRDFGAQPYPMPFVRTPLTVGFQRWVIAGYDKPECRHHIPWPAFQAARCEPRNVGASGRMALPLFGEGDAA